MNDYPGTRETARKHFEQIRSSRFRFHMVKISNGELADAGLAIAYPNPFDFPYMQRFVLVVDEKSRGPVGMGATVGDALADARIAIQKYDFECYVDEYRKLHQSDLDAMIAYYSCQFNNPKPTDRDWEIQSERMDEYKRLEKMREEVMNQRPKQQAPRRRTQVFEKSNGKCHYCGVKLDFDGLWHIEHKHSRALLGGNQLGNLVASCRPCNMKKGDMTEEEFRAGRRADIEEAVE